MKNCKIFATYFGPRRFKEYSNVQNNINKFSKIINSEITEIIILFYFKN